jgi:hypothetical protein
MRKLNARRVGYAVSITLVAAIAAWSSYKHLLDVARIAGQPIEVAGALPLSVDGMLVVASLAMSEDKANGRRPRSWARFAFWLGAIMSVAANIASIVVHRGVDPLGIGVAAWAPIALLVVTEIMARPGRPSKDVVRSEAARRGAQTRKDNATKRTRKPRTRKPVTAPVSPGFGPVPSPTLDEVEAAVA